MRFVGTRTLTGKSKPARAVNFQRQHSICRQSFPSTHQPKNPRNPSIRIIRDADKKAESPMKRITQIARILNSFFRQSSCPSAQKPKNLRNPMIRSIRDADKKGRLRWCFSPTKLKSSLACYLKTPTRAKIFHTTCIRPGWQGPAEGEGVAHQRHTKLPNSRKWRQ
jgi:hypothetical protein